MRKLRQYTLLVISLLFLCNTVFRSSHVSPTHWALLSVLVWLSYISLQEGRLQEFTVWDSTQVILALLLAMGFVLFLDSDKGFKDWGDVFYFCGPYYTYCDCNFRWNLLGYMKAIILWGFVVSFSLGVQKLGLTLCLNGLQVGDEDITTYGLLSIFWRMVPFWLNNWEQREGAQSTAALYELPVYIFELMVVLPLIRVMHSRFHILNEGRQQQIQQQRQLPGGNINTPEFVVPNVIEGIWEAPQDQRSVFTRLRKNMRVIILSFLIITTSIINSSAAPYFLEKNIQRHSLAKIPQMLANQIQFRGYRVPKSKLSSQRSKLSEHYLQLIGSYGHIRYINQTYEEPKIKQWVSHQMSSQPFSYIQFLQLQQYRSPANASQSSKNEKKYYQAAMLNEESLFKDADMDKDYLYYSKKLDSQNQSLTERNQNTQHYMETLLRNYCDKGCRDPRPLIRQWTLQAEEVGGLSKQRQQPTFILLQISVALMRLSYEDFFQIVAQYLSAIIFPTRTPWIVKVWMKFIYHSCKLFSMMLLYTYPACCWIFRAGILFSALSTYVFWMRPIMTAFHAALEAFTLVVVIINKDKKRQFNSSDSCCICLQPLLPMDNNKNENRSDRKWFRRQTTDQKSTQATQESHAQTPNQQSQVAQTCCGQGQVPQSQQEQNRRGGQGERGRGYFAIFRRRGGQYEGGGGPRQGNNTGTNTTNNNNTNNTNNSNDGQIYSQNSTSRNNINNNNKQEKLGVDDQQRNISPQRQRCDYEHGQRSSQQNLVETPSPKHKSHDSQSCDQGITDDTESESQQEVEDIFPEKFQTGSFRAGMEREASSSRSGQQIIFQVNDNNTSDGTSNRNTYSSNNGHANGHIKYSNYERGQLLQKYGFYDNSSDELDDQIFLTNNEVNRKDGQRQDYNTAKSRRDSNGHKNFKVQPRKEDQYTQTSDNESGNIYQANKGQSIHENQTQRESSSRNQQGGSNSSSSNINKQGQKYYNSVNGSNRLSNLAQSNNDNRNNSVNHLQNEQAYSDNNNSNKIGIRNDDTNNYSYNSDLSNFNSNKKDNNDTRNTNSISNNISNANNHDKDSENRTYMSRLGKIKRRIRRMRRWRKNREEIPIQLSCGHQFHQQCIARWVQQCLQHNKVPSCPLCKEKLNVIRKLKWPWQNQSISIQQHT